MASAKTDFTSVNFCTCQILSATGLPLVSEFNHIMQIPAEDPLPSNARLIGTPAMGDIASAGLKTVGVHRTPQEFVEAAITAKHPGVATDQMPGPMLDAVQFCLNHSVSQVAQRRSEVVRRIIFQSSTIAGCRGNLKRMHVTRSARNPPAQEDVALQRAVGGSLFSRRLPIRRYLR